MRGLYRRKQDAKECAESPPHPALRADLSPQAGRGERNDLPSSKHRSRPPLGIDDVAQAVAEQIEAEHRDHQRKAGE